MSNTYKKDKSYIVQRLEYVSPVDYISELEEQIENLQNETEHLRTELNSTEKKCKKANKYIKEIERLNTGIEEVYNVLRKRLGVDRNGYYFTVLDYEFMLKKLEELKGSDNNG